MMKRGSGVLNPGMRGFLLTGSGKEEFFTREAITVFTEHNDKINTECETTETKFDDADYELFRELNEMRNRKKAPFREVKLGIKHTTFVQCDHKKPEDFLLSLLTEVKDKGVKKTRYLERILPVSVTTTAKREEISKSLSHVLQPHIDAQTGIFPSFTVVFKITNNDVMSKDLIQEMVSDILVGWTPVHERADLTVLVNVFRGLCCLSAVTKYTELSRYNIGKLVEPRS